MRVGLVDDHDIVWFGVRAAVAQVDGLQFVGGAGTVAELLALHTPLDIVILDLRLEDGSSPVLNVELLSTVGARTIIFTSGESPFLVRSVAKSPIYGLVRKSAPWGVLAETLRKVASGDVEMSIDWAAAMDSDPDLDAAGLSPQEKRVLGLIASGVKDVSAASTLGISKYTLDDYLRRIRIKYAAIGRPVQTRIDLYRRAVEDGILPSSLLPPARDDDGQRNGAQPR